MSITSDLDWAPDHVTNFLLDTLDKYSIKSTIFCTHKVKINKHELGIHPFVTGGKDDRKIIKKFLSYVPGAKGVRAHRLLNYSPLYTIYKENGIEYDSTNIIPRQAVKPFLRYPGVLEIPISFEDDLYFLQKRKSFNIKELDINRKGIHVFNFHPIHVFLNTETMQRYTKSKPFLRDEIKLKSLRNVKRGTYDLLIELLEYINKKNIKCYTLKEINKKIRKEKNFETKRYC